MKRLAPLVVLLLICASLVAQQGMGPGPGVKSYSAGGGPFVNDTFTEGSDTTLASHTGETGATWTLHPSYSGAVLVNASLDRVFLNTSSSAAYYASGTPPSANYCVTGNFQRLSQIPTNASINIGMSTSADTMIQLRLNDSGSDPLAWEVIDRTTGTSNFLATVSNVHIPAVGGAAVTAMLCRSGTALTAFFNGVQDTGLNATTSITATGTAGIRLSGQATSTTGIHLDNFSAQ